MIRSIVWVALAGCAPEYELSGVAPPVTPELAHAPRGRDPAPKRPRIGKDSPRPGRLGIGLPAAAPDVTFTMSSELGVAATDYLFVLDDSSSMSAVIRDVFAGFDALAEEGIFPSDARIGVMSTLPSVPDKPGRVHRAAPNDPWLVFDPGFGGLVDAARIDRFRREAPAEVAERYSLDGCDAWFTPDQRNAQGVPCLVAHTQTLLFPVHVEAGLVALGQRLDQPSPLFRTGAAVNVIFVSDTHDPGVPADNRHFAELDALRPTFAQLEAMALDRQALASFRVHAVAPADKCSSENWSGVGPVYFDAAREAGGEVLDICTATPADYVQLIRDLATNGALPQRPVLAVAAARDVASVWVDGAPVPFSVAPDGRAVVLGSKLQAQAQAVTLRYRRDERPAR